MLYQATRLPHQPTAYPCSFLTSARPRTAVVPVQGNGSIRLDIHHPLTAAPCKAGPRAILIYLPRGPVLDSQSQDAANVSTLTSSLPYTIVQLNYRAGSSRQYPGPVHDVLAGYDWVLTHLFSKRAITRPGRSEYVGKVAVCGELVGGGLASMLALTECPIGRPGIAAAAVNNPVVDWVFPERSEATEDHGLKERPWSSSSYVKHGEAHFGLTAKDLVTCRNRLFRKPEHYFDPFASPTLFLRSAGVDILPARRESSPLSEMEQLSFHYQEDFHRQQLALSALSSQSSCNAALKQSDSVSTPARRKASRNYPSNSLGLRLPAFYVSAGYTSPLRDQATEFVNLVRKAVIRQSKSSASEFGRKRLLDHEEDQLNDEERLENSARNAEAEDKVGLTTSLDLGLWDRSPAGLERLRAMAEWFRERLG